MTTFYTPAEVPLPVPSRDERQTTPIPESLWRDDQIRGAMEYSVSLDESTVLALTKELVHRELTPTMAVAVEWPFLPPRAGEDGSNNKELKMFAYEAFEALAAHFGDEPWDGWTVAPYFALEDDTRRTLYLGLFIDESFNQTVVE